MDILKVVPGKVLKKLIKNGASVEEIAAQVKAEALSSGLRGDVGILIDIPDQKSQEAPQPSEFVKVA